MIARSQLTALGGVTLVVLAIAIGFSALSDRQQYANAAAAALAKQEVLLLRNVRKLKVELVEAQERENATARLWQAQNAAAPIGAAQQAITNIISAEGGMILSLSDIQETTIGNLGAVRLNVEAEADLGQWQRVMRGFAEYEPVILVSSVELRRINRVVPGSEQPLVLFRLTLDVPFAREAG